MFSWGCLAGILFSVSLTIPSTVAGTFSTGFDSVQPPGTRLFGSAFMDSTGGVNGSGVLKLTTAGNGLMGSFIINEIDGSPPVGPFTATFKMLVGGGNGADGLSFNFASDLPDDIFGEEGAGTGLTVSFDTFDNGGGEAPAIDAKVGGVVIGAVPGSAVFRTGDFVDVLIQVATNGTLDVTVNGTAIFDNLPVALDLSNSGRFGFGARTGGLNDNHFIDDLTITTGSPGHPVVTSSSPRGNNVRPDAVVNITIQEFETDVDPASIQLRFDGTLVTPQISKAGDVTTVQYDPPGLLPEGSSHVVSLTYSDNGSPVFTETITYNFTVADSGGPNGNFYEVVLVPTGITWPEAKAAADARTYNGVQGHLATITSAEEDTLVHQLRQQNRPTIGQAQLWIGGSQTVPDAPPTLDWFWENDEGPIAGINGGDTYANWLPGEPNDYWGPATENYLAIGLNDAFGWNDDGFLDGGRLGGYIVEYETGSGAKPLVDLTAIRWVTGEPCPTCFVAPAIIRVSRSGPTNDSLTVHLAEGRGTASPTVDYPPVPSSVTIPAGSASVEVPFLALDDQLVEGPEVARIRFVPSPDYQIHSFGDEVLITILDDEANAPTARLDIIAPTNGAHFLMGRTIELSALAVNVNNEVYGPVEFYAGDQLVARSPVTATTRPALPGLASIHTAYWTNPPSGPHILTARTQISFDTWITSPPVNITIQSPPGPVVRLETLPPQNAQAPEFCPLNADCAYPSFVVRRSGSTDGALIVYLNYTGTAAPGADYPQLPSSVIIPAGSAAAFVMLVPTDDSLVEGPETLIARFTPIPGTTYFEDPSASSATITIIDNDTAPPQNVVSIFAEDPIATESPEVSIPEIQPDLARFRIFRTGDLSRELRVFFSVRGSAIYASDYQIAQWPSNIDPPTSWVIPAGSNSVVLQVLAREDNTAEGMETVLVRLAPSPLASPLPTYEVSRAQDFAVAGIFDQGEKRPEVEIVTPRNGEHFYLGTSSIDIIFAAFHPVEIVTGAEIYAGTQKIGQVFFPIPAPLDGPPISFVSHRFTWPQPPNGAHTLTVRAMRGAQTVFATSAPVNITVEGFVPLPVMRIETISPIAEENTGPLDRLPRRGTFRIWRDGPTNSALQVWVIYSGTSTAGTDYESLPSMVTVSPGTNSTFLVVSAIPDDLPEGIESVVARISNCPPNSGPPVPCSPFNVDSAHGSATVFVIDEPQSEASLAITRPANGAAFNPGQTILIEATAVDLEGYISRVEFFAGENRIGVSEIVFIVPPAPGTPIQHRFEWRNAPPGQHVLTARASRSNNIGITSPPVNITVLGEPPGDRELHVVGVYTGAAPGGGVSHNNEQGDAAVRVNRPGKRVTLVLSAYEPVVWHLTVGDATVIDRIILGGYYRQRVEGVGSEVQIIDLTFANTPENYLYVGYSLDCPGPYRAFERIRAMTGLEISSFHGEYLAPYPEPFVIDNVQDDPRLRADYPVPTPGSQLPNLQFQLSFSHRGSGEVFTRRYTLAGPQEDSRLLPAVRVIRDGGTRYYYGLSWHEPFRVDTQTHTEQPFEPPATLPELSWPWGLTYDPQRSRVLLSTFGGEGDLYGYAPASEQWSIVRSMDNRDVDSLEYHAANDSLYGLTVFGGECGSPSVMKFTPGGEFQSQFPLDLQAYGLSLGSHTTELVSVGEYLVLLLEPSHPHNYEQSESRMYLIDPRTGESWLTYRSRGVNPANQPPQITVTRPASGAEFPADTEAIDIDASTHDPDGYVRRVEFFANGLKIGETSMDFILPPPPGQSQTFSFTWRDPAPGSHVLTTRAIDDDGASAMSQGVSIRIGVSNAFPVVNVYAPDSYATEPSSNSANAVLDTATFRIVRTGPTNTSLPVGFRLYGTAQNGVDYETLSASVVIPPGQRSATVTVRPLADQLAEDIESIVIELMPPPPIVIAGLPPVYLIGSRGHAAAVIADSSHAEGAGAVTCTPVAGALHISFKATTGNYRVEASTDLINWETVSTTAAVNETVNFVETDRTRFPRRFYRIVPEPLPLASE